MKKGLWVTDSSTKDRLLAKAKLMGASSVCVRTDNRWLKDSIADFHAEGIEVYGWRWPAVEDKGFEDSHYFAQHQADHVANELMPAGLDGYVLDAEGASDHPSRDWNSETVDLVSLTKYVFETIRAAEAATVAGRLGKGRFLMGLSSGNRFPTQQPHLPWSTIVGYCDTLFPQTYWRTTKGTGKDRRVISVHDGTPQSTVDLAMTAWSTIEAGRRVVPTGGPLSLCSVEDLVAFAGLAEARGWDEIHCYIDEPGVDDAKYEALAKV